MKSGEETLVERLDMFSIILHLVGQRWSNTINIFLDLMFLPSIYNKAGFDFVVFVLP